MGDGSLANSQGREVPLPVVLCFLPGFLDLESGIRSRSVRTRVNLRSNSRKTTQRVTARFFLAGPQASMDIALKQRVV